MTANKSATFDDDAKKLVIATSESCFDTTDNGDGTVTITNYHIETCSYDIVIPEKISGKYVSIIGKDAFAGIKECESEGYCSLPKITSVDLSNMSYLVEIKENAFNENLITSLNIGNLPALTIIGSGAFNGNYGPGGNMIDNLVLKDLPKLTTISDGAFSGNSLTTIELNNLPMLTTIGEYAFDGLTAKSIILKDLPVLTTIGSMAFSRDKWTTETNGVSYSYNNCSPTYTFDNVPSVQAYDSTAKTGMSTLAFGQYPSACGASAAGDCKDEPAPVVNILNNVSSELKKSTIFDGVDTWECPSGGW